MAMRECPKCHKILLKTPWGYKCLFCDYVWLEVLSLIDEEPEPLMNAATEAEMNFYISTAKKVKFVAFTQEDWAEEKRRRKLTRTRLNRSA